MELQMNRTMTLAAVLIGFSIILLFLLALIKSGIDSQSAFLCEKFHENNLDMQQCPAHKSSSSWLITLSFGVASLILGIGLYMLFAGREHEPEVHERQMKPADIEKMDNEERSIYELVKAGSGSAYQSDLIKSTGYSKVKITRLLDKMESKGVIERKRRGMTNIIVLR